MCKLCEENGVVRIDNSSGLVISKEERHDDLKHVVGELRVESNILPNGEKEYQVVVFVSGIEPNLTTVGTVAKYPTQQCPHCGKKL